MRILLLSMLVWLAGAACAAERSLPPASEPDAGNGATSCGSSAACAFVPGATVCDVVGQVCVQCVNDMQCPTHETCRHDETCHGTIPCGRDEDCNAASVCGPDGTCVISPGRCQSSQDCVNQVNKICIVALSICVACVVDSDCGPDGVATCNAHNVCVPEPGRCRQSADCRTATAGPVCDTATDQCVECNKGSDCQSQVCQSHQCAPLGTCTNNAGCAHVSGKPICQTATGQCVACAGDGDCASGRVCRDNVCLPSTGCTANSDCADAVGHPACDGASGRCVQCARSTDCHGVTGKPVCDTSADQCVQCLSGEDCGSGSFCSGHACRVNGTCATSVDCAATPSSAVCNTTSGLCVECASNGDCSSGGRCSAGHCLAPGACGQDSDCPSDKPVCEGGSCTTCTATRGCSGGVCDPLTNSCVACRQESDCGSGHFCLNYSCQPNASPGTGCSTILNCWNQCPAGSSCEEVCILAGGQSSQSAFHDYYECVYAVCPQTGGGVCDHNSGHYVSDDCNMCLTDAGVSACVTQRLACTLG